MISDAYSNVFIKVIPIRYNHARSKILTLAMCLTVSLGAAEDVNTVHLESSDGRKIKVKLLEKSADKVKFKLGFKVHTLPLTKLSEDSVEIVKNANIPTICNFKLDVDFKKSGDKVSRNRQVTYSTSDGTSTRTETDSYRVDTITGKVTVKNLDTKDASPAAKLYVVVLINGTTKNQVIQRQVFTLEPIGKIGELHFKIPESKTNHTPRGQNIISSGNIGRYSGYIAAIVIDGRIVEIDAASPGFENDIKSAEELLQIGK